MPPQKETFITKQPMETKNNNTRQPNISFIPGEQKTSDNFVPSLKQMLQNSKKKNSSKVYYALSTLVETLILAFSLEYCSPNWLVNQCNIVTMKFLEQLLRLSWLFERTRQCKFIYVCINFNMALCREMSIEEIWFSNGEIGFKKKFFLVK